LQVSTGARVGVMATQQATDARQLGLTENDGHEIVGQDIYRLKIDYITMQCAILFKTTAEYKSQQRSKLYRPPVIVFRLSGSFSFSPFDSETVGQPCHVVRLEGSTAKSKSVPCRPIQTPATCPAFSCPSFSCPSFSAPPTVMPHTFSIY